MAIFIPPNSSFTVLQTIPDSIGMSQDPLSGRPRLDLSSTFVGLEYLNLPANPDGIISVRVSDNTVSVHESYSTFRIKAEPYTGVVMKYTSSIP